MNELNCTTTEIKQLTDQIYRIRIQPEKGNLFEFKGGQYLYLLMPDGKRIPLSIASAPEQKAFIELHIRLIPGHDLAADMLNLFKTATRLHIEGPYGECFLKQGDKDLVIIAGGTGFSPMKSLLESALAQGTSRKLSLYLGAQASSDLYQSEIINEWNHGQCQFTYIPVVSETDKNWTGETGFPHEVALAQLGEKSSECEFYVSGSEAMVMNVYQSLVKAGVPKDQIHSDILDIKREMGQLI
ncbi:NAD(P)H-flavin reductase [Aliikangiella coralliicola]|uniref:NAD(P)H-flavin reductase n=1 Tax=Aliikangiella coralliicola TaxID=2592383 RepID=A0A545UID9_9GAMM|nr:NAD(P)H-flavin reductase [Aliikangiella coralliicola]TQV89236.1 NAD(P)H-flavin reductase [Aliikangiella coralliicola]